MRTLLASTLLVASSWAWAGPKEDFVDAVTKQCGKSAADAEKLATPGRTGTVVQYSTCASPTVDAGEGCTLKCTKSGSSIGN